MARKNNEVIGEFVAELLNLPVGDVFQYQDKVFWATKKHGIFISTVSEWRIAVEKAMNDGPDNEGTSTTMGRLADRYELMGLMRALYNTTNEAIFLGELEEDD